MDILSLDVPPMGSVTVFSAAADPLETNVLAPVQPLPVADEHFFWQSR